MVDVDPDRLISMLCEGKSSYEICAVFRINRGTLTDRVSKLKAKGLIKEVGLRMLYAKTSGSNALRGGVKGEESSSPCHRP